MSDAVKEAWAETATELRKEVERLTKERDEASAREGRAILNGDELRWRISLLKGQLIFERQDLAGMTWVAIGHRAAYEQEYDRRCDALDERDTALRDLAQAREYITALSADCKRLEEDREYNAGLVTQARERVIEMERALVEARAVIKIADESPTSFTHEQAEVTLGRIRAALSANPGEADKTETCAAMVFRLGVREPCGLPRGHWKRGAR